MKRPKKQLERAEDRAGAKPWRRKDGQVGDLTQLDDLLEDFRPIYNHYSSRKGGKEYARVRRLSDRIGDDLVLLMDARLLMNKDLVTVQNLLRLAKEVEQLGGDKVSLKVEKKYQEELLKLGRTNLDRVGSQLGMIASPELLLDGSRKVLTLLQPVHLYAKDVPELIAPFLQYCTAFSVKILELLRTLVSADPKSLTPMSHIAGTIDAMCNDVSKGGETWEPLTPKVQEIAIQKSADLLPGKLAVLEEELSKTSRMSRVTLMGTLADITPLWLRPAPEFKVRMDVCLKKIEERITDAFEQAVQGGEINKLDALVALAKEYDEHVQAMKPASGSEAGKEPLPRTLERKRAGVTLKMLLTNAEGSVKERTKALQEAYAETEAAVKKLPRGKFDEPAEGARWSFRLGSGGFKRYGDDKNAEVEKMYTTWIAEGKPSGDRARKEITITVDSSMMPRKGAKGEAKRPRCKYGEKCYRKNVEHRKEFSHPTDPDWDDEGVPPTYSSVGPVTPPESEMPGPEKTPSSASLPTPVPPPPPMPSSIRQELYVIDFQMMTQTRMTLGGSARRLIKREEGMTVIQKTTCKYYNEVVEFVKEFHNMLEKAEVELRMLGEDERKKMQAQVDTLLKAMEPSVTKFLELAVFCKDKESLKVIADVEALLGVRAAERLGIASRLRDLYLNDILNDLRKAYLDVPAEKTMGPRKWNLIRLLCKKQVVGPKRLLKCRLARVKTKLEHERAKHLHLRMRCQGLLAQYERDKDFSGQFKKSSVKVLETATKRAADKRDTEEVMELIKTANLWGCDTKAMSDMAGQMMTSIFHSIGKFKWETIPHLQEMLETGNSLADAVKRPHDLFDLKPELQPIVSKILDSVLAVTQKGDEGMPGSVKQVVDIRTRLRGPVVEGFDKTFWEAFKPRYSSITNTEHTTRLTEWAIAYSERVKLALPDWMLKKDQVEALNKLQEAVDSQDEQKIRQAVVFAKQCDYKADLKLLKLYDDSVFMLKKLKRLPSGWEVDELVGDGKEKMFRKADLDGAEIKALFQKAFDDTKASIVTRDRVGAIPRGYKVEQIISVMNAEAWGSYLKRLDDVADQCKKFPGRAPCPDSTWESWSGKIATHAIAKEILSITGLPELATHANEFLMFHGTKPEAADSIAKNNFDMAHACKTGLFGAGLYFAESSSKSDEYVKPDKSERYPVVICRVTLGHINYCPNKDPTTDPGRTKLEASCLGGEYHSVLGDRKKAKGTYREFVVYNHHQVYPHFIVWYKRI